MAYRLTPDEVSELFGIQRSDQVVSFLRDLAGKAPGGWKWRPLGDRVANAANVEVLSEPGPALIERITNAMDAMLELRHQQVGFPDPGPQSPRQASESWFRIQGGTLSRAKDGQTIRSLAPNIRVALLDSSQPKRPTITVTDTGIGQHPTDLPRTILSLGESNKIDRHYLCGAYGQGGSATFAWCEYTIVVSRRRLEHAEEHRDLVGWTVVRRHDDVEYKTYTYQYLTTEERVMPTFHPSALSQVEFRYGTYIAHISYEVGRLLEKKYLLDSYRYMNCLLFDPVVPYTLYHYRASKPGSRGESRPMYGSRGLLTAAQTEYTNEYQADLGSEGSLTIRYWVFYDKRWRGKEDSNEESSETGVSIGSYLESRHSSRTVVITLNGQRHAYLDRSFVKKATRYSLLSDTLLVQVDCDQLSRQRKKDLFLATRSGIRSGEERLDLIEKSVKTALEGDDSLKRLEYERVKRRLATVDRESEEKVKKLLDQLIAISRPSVGPGADAPGSNGQVPSGTRAFRPKDPPTFFRFAEEKRPLRIQAGEKRVVDILTDGPDDLFTRTRRKARLTLELIGDQAATLRAGPLHIGRMGVTVAVSEEAKPVMGCQLRAVFEMDGGVYFATQRPLQIAPPPPPYIGQEPPTKLAIVTKSGVVRLRRGATSRIAVETDCRDDLLSRPTAAARFEIETSTPSIYESRRGPREGVIEAGIRTPASENGAPQDTITARLTLADGTILEDTKPCRLVDPPPVNKDRGRKKRSQPNYRIIEVWRDSSIDRPDATAWGDVDDTWDETHVGKYDLTRDDEGNDLLLLYLNMDNRDLRQERERRLRSNGELATGRLEVCYKAYIGYHLWLQSQEKSDHDQDILQEEMRRVAKTVILAMRSEASFVAAAGDEASLDLSSARALSSN